MVLCGYPITCKHTRAKTTCSHTGRFNGRCKTHAKIEEQGGRMRAIYSSLSEADKAVFRLVAEKQGKKPSQLAREALMRAIKEVV